MKRYIVAVFIMGIIAGCGSSSPAGPQSGSDSAYYPLAVGNQWVYNRFGSI